MRGWADCIAEEQDNADHSGVHTEKIKTEEHNNAHNKARFTQARTKQNDTVCIEAGITQLTIKTKQADTAHVTPGLIHV